jgi:ankyrin repeat protein
VDDIFELARTGDAGRLQALLQAQPGLVNARDARGNSPVLIAQYRDKKEAVDVLLAAGPELDIFDSAAIGRSGRVAEWLDRDPALLEAKSSMGFSPLALAAFFGHPDTVRVLLERGADRKEAIGLAAMKGRIEILKLLKEHP